MLAEKKTNRTKLTHHEKEEEQRTKSQDEFDDKRKHIKEKMRSKKVNYVVKDLPIY
jgi:hypothetical protein